jgi:hypothetical protein
MSEQGAERIPVPERLDQLHIPCCPAQRSLDDVVTSAASEIAAGQTPNVWVPDT